MSKYVNYGKIKRDLMISQGARDGRFSTKVVQDKKKKANKNACRKKVDNRDYGQPSFFC